MLVEKTGEDEKKRLVLHVFFSTFQLSDGSTSKESWKREVVVFFN